MVIADRDKKQTNDHNELEERNCMKNVWTQIRYDVIY